MLKRRGTATRRDRYIALWVEHSSVTEVADQTVDCRTGDRHIDSVPARNERVDRDPWTTRRVCRRRRRVTFHEGLVNDLLDDAKTSGRTKQDPKRDVAYHVDV